MRNDKEENKGSLRERIKRRWMRSKGDPERSPSSSSPSTDKVMSLGNVHASSNPPTQTEPVVSYPSEQSKYSSSDRGLWERAADSLDPGDRDKLDKLVGSGQQSLHGYMRGSLVDNVNSTILRAEKLKEAGKDTNWKPVVDKIVKGALAFKSLGDAAVQFDKSGYAALGWSVVSAGLQLAAKAEEAREFVISSSEVITRFLAKYREYEMVFRVPEAGEDFDRLLANVYKAILLYMIALDEYLRQSGLEHLGGAAFQLEARSISSSKTAIDTADVEVTNWLLIIVQKRNDNNFAQLQKSLRDLTLAPEIPDPLQECLRSLAFPGMDDRFNDIERAAEGTCKWLLGHHTYRNWTADDCGMLCIKGKPGSGKSTLLRYAVSDATVASGIRESSLSLHNERLLRSVETPEAQIEPGALILSFFFHDRGAELQKTALGLYRSLLHQLIRHSPESIPTDLLTTFQDRKDKMGEPGVKWHWHWRELRDFFASSLRKALERRPVCLLVDALDEYGKDNANDLIKSFQTWLRECQTQSQLRICFTCRHHPHLALPEGASEIRLESENEHDITAYVQLQLSGLSSSEHLAAIQTDITSRASGVFIWARLIVERVLNLQREGENWKMIREEVEQSPLELNDLYRGLIEQVADKSNSFKLIQWICFAMEPLTLDELRYAMIVEPGLSYNPNSHRDYQSSKHFASNCDMMEKKLTTLSCGLAEVVASSREYWDEDDYETKSVPCGVVQFIHQTVKDFFITEGLSALQSYQSPSIIQTNGAYLEAVAHYQLSITCIKYLSTNEIMQSTLTDSASKSMSEFPLLYYATQHWVAHVRRSEKAHTPNELLSYLGWPSEAVVQHWAGFFNLLGNSDYYAREGATLLHVVSANRCMSPLQDIMDRKEMLEFGIDATTDDGRTSLHLAAQGGHNDVVQLLLKNGANVDCRATAGEWTPLWAAVSCNHEDVVRTLLENGSDPNAENEYFGTMLVAASADGHQQIVRLLLKNGADINAALGEKGTPLLAAAQSGHVDVVQTLLEKGANINAADRWGRTALSDVSSGDDEQIVRMLLENGADANGGSGGLHNPLIRAALGGQGKVVKILLEHGADVGVWNMIYGCALTAALVEPGPESEEIVRMLLEKGADMNAESGQFYNFQSALQMASRKGLETFLQIFREHGTV